MKETQLNNLLSLKEKTEDEEKIILKAITFSKELIKKIEENKDKIKNYNIIIEIINYNLNENLQKKNEIERKKQDIIYQIKLELSKKTHEDVTQKTQMVKTVNQSSNSKNIKRISDMETIALPSRPKKIKARVCSKECNLAEENNIDKQALEELPKKSKGIYERAFEEMLKRTKDSNNQLEFYQSNVFQFQNIENNFFFVRDIVVSELSKNKYIKVNDRKFCINRNLDNDTNYELEQICQNVLKENMNLNIFKKLNLSKLKKKIDPAVVNGLKEYLNGYLNKCNEEIDKYYKAKNLKIEKDEKKLKNLYSKAIEAENLKAKAKNEYRYLLEQYVKSMYLNKNVKLPFKLTYNCEKTASIIEFNVAKKYLNSAQKIGANIIGRRGLLETLKNKIVGNKSSKQDVEEKCKEGDKSFVVKVNPIIIPLSSANQRTKVHVRQR